MIELIPKIPDQQNPSQYKAIKEYITGKNQDGAFFTGTSPEATLVEFAMMEIKTKVDRVRTIASNSNFHVLENLIEEYIIKN